MRKQGSLLIIVVVACVALFAACTPAPTTDAAVECTATPAPLVNYSGCNLTDAGLQRANLRYTNLINAKLTRVTWSNTTCPTGLVQSTQCPLTSAG